MLSFPNKYGCKWTNSLEESKNSHILIIQALAVILTLKIVNQFFCRTHRLVIIHQHTKFGLKWFCNSGSIIWTKSDTWTGRRMDKRTDIQTDGWSNSNISSTCWRRAGLLGQNRFWRVSSCKEKSLKLKTCFVQQEEDTHTHKPLKTRVYFKMSLDYIPNKVFPLCTKLTKTC